MARKIPRCMKEQYPKEVPKGPDRISKRLKRCEEIWSGPSARRDTLILLAARPERFHRLDSQALLVIADRYVALDIGNIAGIP